MRVKVSRKVSPSLKVASGFLEMDDPCTLTYLQFASVQLQELWPIHLPGRKLSGVLLQVETVQPLAHLLAGPVLDSGEGFIQELGQRRGA